MRRHHRGGPSLPRAATTHSLVIEMERRSVCPYSICPNSIGTREGSRLRTPKTRDRNLLMIYSDESIVYAADSTEEVAQVACCSIGNVLEGFAQNCGIDSNSHRQTNDKARFGREDGDIEEGDDDGAIWGEDVDASSSACANADDAIGAAATMTTATTSSTSIVPSPQPSSSPTVALPQLSFPRRLMLALSDPTVSPDTLRWLPDGNGFVIRDKRNFANVVMPLYFGDRSSGVSKYTSFTRKLNRLGYVRVSSGREMGAYYHEIFRRDMCNEDQLGMRPTWCARPSFTSNRF